MVLAARADGVISMEITGDSRDKLEVVGDGVDAVRLVSCLRRKLGHAEILQVEEVKHENPEHYETDKEPDEPPPQCLCYHGYCCHHHLPTPPMVVCEEPSNCPVM
ncbi:hypothetical protein HU200_032202 [Digitaria exilis]|uniref:Uncharacterized protein n=1 Tax=Digitaria exilis TaxID=1010633 RepID=A0A835BNL4_9POAL|nr:hypothetical protein HU200_032202 [Digitaria exilis]